MQAYQWFMLGMMMAWTPGLIILALILRSVEKADASAQR